MRYCTLFILLFSSQLAIAAPAPIKRSDVFKHIEAAYQAGKLSFGKRHLYRVAALRAPELLPPDWRRIVELGAPSPGCYTPVTVEAFQALRSMEKEDRDRLRRLLSLPTGNFYTIEDTQYFPLQVLYQDPSHATKARQIMGAAILSYQKQVTAWGFWEPTIEDNQDYYKIYIMDSGMGGGGYTSPYEMNHNTPHSDAYSYIVIDWHNPNYYAVTTMAHEFNHACQISMDVSELTAFMENSAVYIEAKVYPDSWNDAYHFFSIFQAYPYRPLEYMDPVQTDGYEYGGALWVYFLEYLYANDNPIWLREVWEGTVQYGWTNEPDYFDVIDGKLVDHGGLQEAVKAFARYRFFMGNDDDGQHLPDSGMWRGCEVPRMATLNLSNLPLIDVAPGIPQHKPQPNGCNYIILNISTRPSLPIEFSFSGQSDLLWNVDILKVGWNMNTTHVRIALDAQQKGKVSVDAASYNRLVMVICQLSGQFYEPEHHQWNAGDYRYSIMYDAPPPTVLSATPGQFSLGQEQIPMTIRGTGFVNHQDLRVRLSGDKTAVEVRRFVSSTELEVLVYVAGDAELGQRDIVVRNPGGDEGVGRNLVLIADLDPGPGPVTPIPGSPAGGCLQVSPGLPQGLCLLLMVCVMLFGLGRWSGKRP